MYTGVYWPDSPLANGKNVCWCYNDITTKVNNFMYIGGPSFSVRLLVFEMPED